MMLQDLACEWSVKCEKILQCLLNQSDSVSKGLGTNLRCCCAMWRLGTFRKLRYSTLESIN